MSYRRFVSAGIFAAAVLSSTTQASVVTGLRANDDIIIGDWFMPNQISSFQINEFSSSSTGASLRWSSSSSDMIASGAHTNPLFQYGDSANNPLYNVPELRLSFGGLSSIFTWTNGQPVDLDFTVTFFISNAADPTNTPLLMLVAKGKGTKNPPPPPPPNPGPVVGDPGHDYILGDYIINFNPNQPFTNPNGTPVDAAYRIYTGPNTSWSGLSVVPAPGTAALMGLGGLMAARRRRS